MAGTHAPTVGETTWVGRPLRRFEDRRLLTGAGQYVDDVRPGAAPDEEVLAVAFVRAPYAHAQITRVDVEAARNAPGVIDVATGADTAHLTFQSPIVSVKGARQPAYPPIAQHRVHYVGEVVAAVLATNPRCARDAADLVEIEYDPLPGVSHPEAALAPGAPVLHPDLAPGNEAFRVEAGSAEEDVKRALEAADHVVRLTLRSPRLASVSLEPRTIMAGWDSQEEILRVWASTQRPFGTRAEIAGILGLPAERVHVIAQDVGGGFGTKGIPYREEALVAYFAHKHRRVARWTATRSEEFLSMVAGRDQVTRVEAGFTRRGKLQAIRVTNVGACGAYAYTNTPLPIARVARLIMGAYSVPLARGVAIGAFTNTPPTGPYRGAGRPEGTLLIERTMDVAALELGLDPVDIRRLNFIPADAFPYSTPTGFTYDSGDYERTLDVALEAADFARLVQQREAARRRGDLMGIGLSTFVEPAGGVGYESGRVRVGADGSITAESGSFSHGQGHITTFAQIVADRMGVSARAVRVVQGDTRQVPEGIGTFGSRSVMLGGSALVVCAERVVEKMKTVAGHLLEVRSEEVELSAADSPEGSPVFHPVGVPGRALTFEDVARAAHDASRLPAGLEPGLEESDQFRGPMDSWPHGAHIAAVSVDRDTGRVKVLAYVAVDDAGTIINPLLAEGQVMGGLAQGFGQALYEQIVYEDDGTLLSGTLGDYAVPRATDLPWFTLGETTTPSPLNPLGAKGIGEGGAVGAPPALVNAVVDALAPLGVKHLDLPLTSEKVWRAIQDATPS